MKPRHVRLLAALLVFAGLTAAGGPAAAARAASLEGEWVLVHQYRGQGQADQVDPANSIHLRISAAPGGLSARIWTSGARESVEDWPAFYAGDHPMPIEIEWRSIDPKAGSLKARYQVRTTGEAMLRITERYKLSRDGAALLGTVIVETLSEGRPVGQYLLRRRFERPQ